MVGRSGKGAAGSAAAPPPPPPQPSPSMCEALLFTTMCIVGLPVEVQVKDGSVYSGIFHTASVEKGYDIVLKKARKIVKGKYNGNLPVGASVDTLVVFSGDLVQVIAKGVLLPVGGTVADVEGDGVEAVTGSVHSHPYDALLVREFEQDGENKSHCSKAGQAAINSTTVPCGGRLSTNTLKDMYEVDNGKGNDMYGPEKIEEDSCIPVICVSGRQVGECKPHGEAVPSSGVSVGHLEKVILPETCSSNPYNSTDVFLPHKDISSKIMPEERPSGTAVTMAVKAESSDNEIATSRSMSPSNVHTSNHSLAMHAKRSSFSSSSEMSTLPSSSTNLASHTRTKEFKLNPGAKTFSPSFANSRPVVPVGSTTANIQNTYSMLPIATAQPGMEIGPSANCSVQNKFVQHINLAAGNMVPVSQFPHPITGPAGTRIQPLRLSGQYSSVQTGPTYIFPNSQMVTVGRRGQVMYVHPVSQDAVQGIPTFTQVPPHPLLTPYPANPPKLQGSATPPVQLCVTPPIFPSGQQLPTMPIQIPFSSALSSFQAIQVPGSTNFFPTKF